MMCVQSNFTKIVGTPVAEFEEDGSVELFTTVIKVLCDLFTDDWDTKNLRQGSFYQRAEGWLGYLVIEARVTCDVDVLVLIIRNDIEVVFQSILTNSGYLLGFIKLEVSFPDVCLMRCASVVKQSNNVISVIGTINLRDQIFFGWMFW